MKHLLLTAIILALAAPAFAGPGTLIIYGDAQGSVPCISDTGGNAPIALYLVHRLNPGDEAIASDFRIEAPAGASWTYAGFFSPFATVGNAHTGISVGYGTCQMESFLVGSEQWTSAAPSPPCSFVVVQNGGSGQITVADCIFGESSITNPPRTTVNPNATCACAPVATAPATWGAVKALYR